VNLRRGKVLPCYCFGRSPSGGEMISGRTLARLLLLIAGEIVLEGSVLAKRQPIYAWQAGGLLGLSLAIFWACFALLGASSLLSLTDVLGLLGICDTHGKRKSAGRVGSDRGESFSLHFG